MSKHFHFMSKHRVTEVTKEEVDLSPEMANELLLKNHGNRRLRPGRVKRLAASIARGGWIFNGQAIILDPDGNVLDGQHRLHAIVMAGKTVRVLIVRGVSREAYKTMDAGVARSGSDVLDAGGMTQTTKLAAVLRLVWKYILGVLGSTSAEHQAGNNDLADLSLDHPEVAESIKFCARKKHMNIAPVAFLHWATTKGNKKAADQFWEAVSEGAGLSSGSPALKLRDTLFNNLNASTKYEAIDVLEFCLRAWVYHLANHQVQVLKTGILEHKHMQSESGDVIIPMTPDQARLVSENGIRMKASPKRALA